MAKSCPYCGNNPISHGSAKLTSLVSDLFAPVERRVASSRPFRSIATETQASLPLFLRTLEAVGIARFSGDPSTARFARARFLWEEAEARGIRMESVRILNHPADAYRATVHGSTIYFVAIPRPRTTESGSEFWLDDKLELKKTLSAAGIPVPCGNAFTRFEPLRRYFAELEKPAVLKPRLGSRGRHTTTNIYTESDLRRAFDIAKQISRTVVLEEHLVGSVFRATLVGGELVGVLEGMPPRVTGNGKDGIMQLVERKNVARHPNVSAVALGETHREFLARTGRSFDTILKNGETIDLLEKIGISYGGSSREVTDSTHPETKRILTEAARILNDPLIGFDFIIPDIAASPHGQKWGIIECNSRPFINLHHDPIEGTPLNAARRVWDYVESHLDEF